MSELTVIIGLTGALAITALRLVWFVKKKQPTAPAYKIQFARYVLAVVVLLGAVIFLTINMLVQSS